MANPQAQARLGVPLVRVGRSEPIRTRLFGASSGAHVKGAPWSPACPIQKGASSLRPLARLAIRGRTHSVAWEPDARPGSSAMARDVDLAFVPHDVPRLARLCHLQGLSSDHESLENR